MLSVKPIRRAIALSTAAVLATAGVLLLGATGAQAYPNGIATQAGGVTYNLGSPPVATFTQNAPDSVVTTGMSGSLDIAVGETLNIVQANSSWLMVLNNTTASPIQWNGTINVDANLLVISPAGININGTLTGGGDVILSTGTTNVMSLGPFIPLAPLVTNGGIVVGTTGSVVAGGNLGIAGNDTTIDGSLHADGEAVSIVSDSDVEYNRSAGATTLFADGSGFAGGLILTSSTASVTSTGLIVVEATAPSTATLDGLLEADGEGAVVGEGIPGVVAVVGAAGSSDGQFDALANGAGPAGGQLGAHFFGGDSTPFLSTFVFQLVSYGTPVPSLSQFALPLGTFFDDLQVAVGMVCTTLEDYADPESATVDPYAIFLFDGAAWDGSSFLPPTYDPEIPNQAPFTVPGLGTVAFNEQSTSIVDGYEVLTATALHVVTATEDVTIGVTECAKPAPQLAATGASVDAAPALMGAVLLSLAGVVLVLRRRRQDATR